ncbi:bifunctional adenosylcobinamide kinase/adenosylcobinamide-phosphate guanylyltransferase [Actinoplanes sp. N902-109]|uniref:bifunctional adenosylcobinamide kinase/adenosylcobinamide-phosphate guanylyltransferase n=1 Tax=Actinoplanes sp. (strain N902-109) TaxID=649831 RepID=UPI00032952A8|nr:bifunctional adenosylcobinamide kinase/adenosylcobinamide-phosphate guanylyltransferase [Actinoplanes sp. N902-109]AGL15379.1 cobalbumin biosynthesis protein [Actinoplanes sp. N902-109]
MSADGWSSVLVLGGIRSGKSAFAEALVAGAASVRYIATAVGGEDDPDWLARIEAHQRRRPQAWTTEETGADPARLTALITEAKPDETLLVDDLGGWVAALLNPDLQPNDDVATVTALAEAVRTSAARVVLVTPEVGLSLVPQTPLGRAFADALGTANQALAAACDRVVLVVAGRPAWLKSGADESGIVTDVQAEAATGPAVQAAAAAGAGAAATRDAAGTLAAAGANAAGASAAVHDAAAVPTSRQAATPAQPPAQVTVAAAGASLAPPVAPAAASPGATTVSETFEGGVDIQAGMDLPLPDSDAGPDARDRLAQLDLPGAGVGALIEAIEFAAATQGTATPQPWGPVRVLLLDGRHAGGAAAGSDPEDAARRVAQVQAGEGALARLAATAGADVTLVHVPGSGAMEDGPVLDAAAVDAALRQGWQLADTAAEEGREALVIAACGSGTDAAATAVLAATTGAEPVAVLPRVLAPGGFYDDEAWMRRCAAVRDAMHRIRQEPRGAKDILAQLGGADVAVAAGALLGAAARRMPVLVDGPVGIAAGLVARDLAAQSRHWCLLADAGKHQLVRQGADVLGLTPVLDLGLDLGEGANALAALPLLRTAIALAGALPVHPALLAAPGDAGLSEDAEFIEPEPDGPGPASV